MNKLFFTILLVSLFNVSHSQDLLILKSNKTIEGVVSKLEGGFVSIIKPDISENAINLSISNIEFVITNDGYIIDMAKVDSAFMLDKFKAANKSRLGNESHIVHGSGNIIQTKHITIKLDEVAYYDERINQEASLSISDILITIEKGGKIKLMKNADIIVFKLKSNKYFSYNSDESTVETNLPENKEPSLIDEKETDNSITPIPSVNENQAIEIVEEEYTKPQIENPFEGIAKSDISHEEYQRKSLEKVEDLGEYLSIISDKTVDTYTKTKAKNEAFELFTGASATVEVSNVNTRNVITQKIKIYLEKLQRLNYDKVDIRWSEVGYVSSLRPDQDGNLWGTVSIKQKFTGYRDGIPIYSDVTYKEIEVKFEAYNKSVGGEQVSEWDVYLNNIGVAVTKLN